MTAGAGAGDTVSVDPDAAIVTVALSTLALIAGAFYALVHQLGSRITDLGSRIDRSHDDLSGRMDRLAAQLSGLRVRLATVEGS